MRHTWQKLLATVWPAAVMVLMGGCRSLAAVADKDKSLGQTKAYIPNVLSLQTLRYGINDWNGLGAKRKCFIVNTAGLGKLC